MLVVVPQGVVDTRDDCVCAPPQLVRVRNPAQCFGDVGEGLAVACVQCGEAHVHRVDDVIRGLYLPIINK